MLVLSTVLMTFILLDPGLSLLYDYLVKQH